MNDIKSNLALDLIFIRRSVRSYISKRLDRETIEYLLRAAIYAPRAMHQEPWRFVMTQDQALLKKRACHTFLDLLMKNISILA